MNIIVLNSAPGGGKDTIASYIVNHVTGAYKAEVKALLFDLAIRMSGLNRETWFALYNDRRFKESPCPYLVVAGKQVSLREYLIHISEHVMKPLFGNYFFGKQSAQRLANLFEGNETIVFSDGGFIEEVKELSELAYSTNGHFFLVRVHRGEDDWKNDSRGWLHLSENNIRGVSFDVTNEEGKMEECAEEIIARVSRVMAEKEED